MYRTPDWLVIYLLLSISYSFRAHRRAHSAYPQLKHGPWCERHVHQEPAGRARAASPQPLSIYLSIYLSHPLCALGKLCARRAHAMHADAAAMRAIRTAADADAAAVRTIRTVADADAAAMRAILATELGPLLTHGRVRVFAPASWWDHDNEEHETEQLDRSHSGESPTRSDPSAAEPEAQAPRDENVSQAQAEQLREAQALAAAEVMREGEEIAAAAAAAAAVAAAATGWAQAAQGVNGEQTASERLARQLAVQLVEERAGHPPQLWASRLHAVQGEAAVAVAMAEAKVAAAEERAVAAEAKAEAVAAAKAAAKAKAKATAKAEAEEAEAVAEVEAAAAAMAEARAAVAVQDTRLAIGGATGELSPSREAAEDRSGVWSPLAAAGSSVDICVEPSPRSCSSSPRSSSSSPRTPRSSWLGEVVATRPRRMQTTQRDYLALQPSLQPDVQPDVVQPDLQPNLQLGLQPGNHCAPGGGSTPPPLPASSSSPAVASASELLPPSSSCREHSCESGRASGWAAARAASWSGTAKGAWLASAHAAKEARGLAQGCLLVWA